VRASLKQDMSTLVILLPSRPRLASNADAAPVAREGTAELLYVLSPDGLNIARQGRAKAALLPKADSAIVVLADTDVSWHRIAVPKAPAARLRAAVAGVLEEQLLDDAEGLHFALSPNLVGGQTGWVGVIDKTWLKAELTALDKAGISVERAVPMSWPDEMPLGHFSAAFGDDASAPMQLTWADAKGVICMGVNGVLARQMLPQWTAQPARWSAHPAVAAPAERWLGGSVSVLSDEQRLLRSMRSLWNLLQFDIAPKHRGTVALRDALRRFRSAGWRPVRWGLAALLVLQVIGLNLWSWHQERQIVAKRGAMVALLRDAHPQVRAVLDAPAQMVRETDLLRAAAGKTGDNDLETLLGAAAAAWPAGQAPLQTLKFDNGRLMFAAVGWSEAQVAEFRSQLAGGGWTVAQEGSALTLSRPTVAPSRS
jgi:general secretion pathway protein L